MRDVFPGKNLSTWPPARDQCNPLQEAEMALQDYMASGGDVEFLETARKGAMQALAQGETVGVKLAAGVVAIATGYLYKSVVSPPPNPNPNPSLGE